MPSPPLDLPSSVQVLAPQPALVYPVAAPVAASSEPPSAEESTSLDLRRRGLGFLTIHSTGSYASVYLGVKKYGRVDEKLLVRCGERFVAIGLPRGNGREPTWLASGKTIDVPCGGSLDVRMNPRRLRPRTRRHNQHSVPSRPHR